MASGHVNRANRPNTWLHRPATRREDSPCQLGAVHTWHFASVRCDANSVAIEGIADIRRSLAAGRSDANDPKRSYTDTPQRPELS